jgi:hypothetical protein
MKLATMWGTLALLAIGCGGAAAATPESAEAGSVTAGDAETGGGETTTSVSDAATVSPGFSPVGRWENSSCGERKFLRRINFTDDGTFAALDEVAPCPPKVVCVWSGIIHWRGTWKLDGPLIRLAIEPIAGKKPPEAPPETFVVLADDPPSIGEQAGDLTCPYQLVD